MCRCISLWSRLHPSPPSAVPGSVGVAHNSPPGQTDWGQNEWDELKQLLVPPPPPSLCITHCLMPRKRTNRAADLNCWTPPPLFSCETEGSRLAHLRKEVTNGAFKDSRERGALMYRHFPGVFFQSVFLLTFSTSYFQLTVSAACVYLTESFLSVLSLFTFSRARRVKAFTRRGRDD